MEVFSILGLMIFFIPKKNELSGFSLLQNLIWIFLIIFKDCPVLKQFYFSLERIFLKNSGNFEPIGSFHSFASKFERYWIREQEY